MKNTYKYWVYKANVSLQNESGYIYGGESQVILINAQVRWTKAITNGEWHLCKLYQSNKFVLTLARHFNKTSFSWWFIKHNFIAQAVSLSNSG